MSWRDIVLQKILRLIMEWNGMEWNGMEVVRYRVTNNGLAIKVSIGNEVSIKIAISFMHFLTTNRDFLMKNETKFRYYIDNKIINIKRKKNEEFILFFFIKNIFYLNINRRIFLYSYISYFNKSIIIYRQRREWNVL